MCHFELQNVCKAENVLKFRKLEKRFALCVSV